MKQITRFVMLAIVCVCWSCEDKTLPKDPEYGKLWLPIPTAPLRDEADFAVALAGIRMDPVTKSALREEDRVPFLSYVQQVCAALQVSPISDIYISENADVWRILRANYAGAKEVLENAEKSGSTISVRSVTGGMYKIAP